MSKIDRFEAIDQVNGSRGGVDKTWAMAHGLAHGPPYGLPYGLPIFLIGK